MAPLCLPWPDMGGLSLIWGVYPGMPIENVEAGVMAMEKHRDLWVR